MNKINNLYTRRDMLAMGAGLAAGTLPGLSLAQGAAKPLLSRKIPKTGELLPVIGLGTAIIFDIGNDPAARAERRNVLQTLFDHGARLVDTAPSYGAAEGVVGDLLETMKARDRAFLATKFRAPGRDGAIAEMRESQRLLRTQKFDLMQRHNIGFVREPEAAEHFALMREWKTQGICRYTGVTHSQDQDRAIPRLITILQKEKLDFIQINYSMAERGVEQDLLAAAADTGTAVLCNLPFARGVLFRAVQGKPLPDWAREFGAVSWAQFFLKYLIAHPAINAVMPGTDKVEYMLDNLDAARGVLPDNAMRRRMAAHIDTLL